MAEYVKASELERLDWEHTCWRCGNHTTGREAGLTFWTGDCYQCGASALGGKP